ncbi:MAG: peptide deformylase [Candidatus Omnitrophota bacterium]
MLEIRKYPDPALRKKAKRVKSVGTEEKQLMEDMARAMYNSSGVGLAAPQVGIPKRVIVADAGDGLLKMANPEISSKRRSSSLEEGCLSVPETSVTIKRALEISVSFVDEKNKNQKKCFSDLTARVIQHEIDHLEGKLIIDYLPWYAKILERPRRKKCRK